jgi:hypothetical protein
MSAESVARGNAATVSESGISSVTLQIGALIASSQLVLNVGANTKDRIRYQALVKNGSVPNVRNKNDLIWNETACLV